MISKTDLAYAAGIIDGEGCIFISRTGGKERNKYHYLMIEVNMIDKQIPLWFKDKFNGFFYSRNSKSNKKEIYVWKLTGCAAVELLQSIKPFTKIKNRQIEIAIKFQKTIYTNNPAKKGYKGWRRLSVEVIAIREKFKILMSNANQRRYLDASSTGR